MFLRESCAPWDNNRSEQAEQALKMTILHRKNGLSDKALNGARTGGLFMDLIHTCRLNRVNPFAYCPNITRRRYESARCPPAELRADAPQPRAFSNTFSNSRLC